MIRRADGAFAIDIDGVLADVEAMFDQLAIAYTGQPWPHEFLADARSESESIPEDVLVQIFDDFHMHRIAGLALLPGAKEALEQLRDRYRLVLITARRASSEALTREWLDRHGIPFDALYHLENKADAPERLAVAIDDHPRHITRYLEQGIQCFIMDYPRNRHVEPDPHLMRVQGWTDVVAWLLGEERW